MIDVKKLRQMCENMRVLYAEDDAGILRSTTRYLEKFFSSVLTAADGLEAWELYQNNSVDIVITDLSMPNMSGIDLIHRIKKLHEGQSVLVTTAHSESAYLMDAIKIHVDGYLLKPFDYELLNFELYKIAEKIEKFKENIAYKKYMQEMLAQQSEELNDNFEQTLYSMIDLIEKRDTYTAGHSKRVAMYCEMIAQEMGYSKQECLLIHQAGILHDIGKIETPDAVLLNPKTLNEIEYKLIQEHVQVGYKLLKNIPMFKAFADIVNAHHERYDGKGYPNALKGEEIDKLARIMIVADSFDAMTTNRIYKARKSVAEAIEELRALSGTQFDPEVVLSAVVVLKDIVIDESISQLPKTQLEEERFAYFYKDRNSKAYNQNYLDVVLLKNLEEMKYGYMSIFSLKKFSYFNKKNGWAKGDEVLKTFANILCDEYTLSLVFRVFGDDFVVMSAEKIDANKVNTILNKSMKENSLSYAVREIDLKKEHIVSLADIEMLQLQ